MNNRDIAFSQDVRVQKAAIVIYGRAAYHDDKVVWRKAKDQMRQMGSWRDWIGSLLL